MHLQIVASHVVPLISALATDPVPDDNDVKAGYVAFAIFIGLILAVAFLGWSLTKQLRKAQAAEDAGLYDPSDKKKAPTPPMQYDAPPDEQA